MFYSLNGELIHLELGVAVIDCSGVAYKCFITMNTQKKLPKIGSKVMMYTHLNVKEDAMDLFGFLSLSELNCFKTLISVSGVGVKVAIAILSEFSPEQITVAIVSGDSKTITKASGVGNKLSQRIILELKDKFKDIEQNEGACVDGILYSNQNISEAIKALVVLGYSASEITPIVSKIDSGLPIEQIIKLALKAMSGR